MAKGQRKISTERFIEAIPGTGGLYTVIAGKLGVDRHTVSEYIKRDPVLAAAVQDEIEGTLDKVESVFINACLKKDIQACMFYLRTKGKSRGYTYKIYDKRNQREQSQTSDTSKEFKEILHRQQVPVDSRIQYRSRNKSAHHPTGCTALNRNLDSVPL